VILVLLGGRRTCPTEPWERSASKAVGQFAGGLQQRLYALAPEQ
jgi:hypothetical protein